MITVQPIRYTSTPQEWHRLAGALGLTSTVPARESWAEFDGDGILAVHLVGSGSDDDATTELHLLTDDLRAVESAATSVGATAEGRVLDDIGELLTISLDEVRLTVSAGARSTAGPVSVNPIWYAEDLRPYERLFRALGLRPRIASDTGTWIDFHADGGGLVALHRGEPRLELAFELASGLETVGDRVRAAGFAAEIVDEAYNRTLRVAGPGGLDLWVNGAQEDLYGFHRPA